MNFIEEFRNSEVIKPLIESLQKYNGPDIKLMEVCGTHTMAISRYGLRSLLPKNIQLVSGPGCPVCVTPISYIDSALELADRPEVIITTFGDMMRIPGMESNLLTKKAQGKKVQMVYSPLDAVELAKKNPDKEVVFLSVGFETTTPVIALAVLHAYSQGATNFSILSANKTMPEAIIALSQDKELAIDGFIFPGHVSAIIGTDFFESVTNKYNKAGAVTGFEPLDMVYAIKVLVDNISSKNSSFENLYSRIVKKEGNRKAVDTMNKVFEPYDAIWRGIGLIENSGLKVREEFKSLDASAKFGLKELPSREPAGCKCGDILKGKLRPVDCPLFKRVCTPENPVGACMVSSEGTCAAYYKYCD